MSISMHVIHLFSMCLGGGGHIQAKRCVTFTLQICFVPFKTKKLREKHLNAIIHWEDCPKTSTLHQPLKDV